MIIAIDFDGTITDSPTASADELHLREGCKETIQALHDADHELILWTCRSGSLLQEALDFLTENGMWFDYINQQVDGIITSWEGDTRKVYADIYIDDKGFGVNLDTLWADVSHNILGVPKISKVSALHVFEEYISNLEPLPDNTQIQKVVPILMTLQYTKELSYGSSWKARGELRSIIPNIDRKYDRLDNMTQYEMEGKMLTLEEIERSLSEGKISLEEVGESKVDAIGDLANYSLLYMSWVAEKFPLLFRGWLYKNLPKEVSCKFDIS